MPTDFEHARRRSRFEAWILDASAGRIHAQHGKRKAAAIGAMRGTVVELGPGTGVNMRYYAPGVKVIGIEPNPTMHPRLRTAATEHDVDLEIRTLRGEQLDVEDASVDGVVATLVLCSVDDQQSVLAEVMRVLRPGGTFFFIDHVGAAHGSRMRRFQHVMNRPHRWLFNGCEVCCDTADEIRAAGFSSVELDEFSVPRGLYMPDQIAGVATR